MRLPYWMVGAIVAVSSAVPMAVATPAHANTCDVVAPGGQEVCHVLLSGEGFVCRHIEPKFQCFE